MSLSLYQVSVPPMLRQMKALAAVLDKAVAYADERKIDHGALLHARLYPDMYHFIRQIQAVTDMAKGGAARLANVEVPTMADDESSIADLKARLARTIAFLEALKPAQFEGREDAELQIPLGRETRAMKAIDYFLGFVLPNFYFHSATAYGILRHNGVPIGKRDFIGRL